jgi:hypothetical protein
MKRCFRYWWQDNIVLKGYVCRVLGHQLHQTHYSSSTHVYAAIDCRRCLRTIKWGQGKRYAPERTHLD